MLQLLRQLRAERNLAMVLVTHNLSVVAEICDKVVVMYAGRWSRKPTVYDLFERPQHPYTQQLLKAIPMFPHDGERLDAMPVARRSRVGRGHQGMHLRGALRLVPGAGCATEQPPVAGRGGDAGGQWRRVSPRGARRLGEGVKPDAGRQAKRRLDPRCSVSDDLTTHFPVGGGCWRRLTGKRQVVHALDGVSLDSCRGETLGRDRGERLR